MVIFTILTMEAQSFTSKRFMPMEMPTDEVPMETDVDMVDEEEKLFRMQIELFHTERKFRRACEQIVLLNYKLSGMQARYEQAKEKNLRTFRYTYRLQLAAIEGVKNVYHDYAVTQAERIRSLQMDIFGEVPDDSDEDPDEFDVVDQV